MLSVIILAGGYSQRMGKDKAFLQYKNEQFVSLVAKQAVKVSEDVVVAIGEKGKTDFENVLRESSAKIINDTYKMHTPLAGMLTAFDVVKNYYAAVVACDLPLVKSSILEFLKERALNHSAAVPVWDDSGALEPLCAVYKVHDAKDASIEAVKAGSPSPKSMIARLPDVDFVKISELKSLDSNLESFLNINSDDDYSRLISTN